MKNLEKLSKKAIEFCELSGYNVEAVKEAMKSNSFAVQVCENKTEMEENGVDFNFPYVIWNPCNLPLSESICDDEDESDEEIYERQVQSLNNWKNSDNED